MTTRSFLAVRTVALAAVLFSAPAAFAQDQGSPGLFGGLFDHGQNRPQTNAQSNDSDLMMRLDRLENALRQLTGSVEQLQYRNQQLEQTVKRLQEDTDYRFQELGGKGGRGAPPPPSRSLAPAQGAPPPAGPGRRSDAYEPSEGAIASAQPSGAPPAQLGAPPAPPGALPPPPGQPGSVGAGRSRGDAFDPSANPGAPGAPRVLGSIPEGGAPQGVDRNPPPVIEAPAGVPPAPGGRAAGAPLDLSTMAANAASDPSLGQGEPARGSALPPPPPRNPSATGPVAMVEPPSGSPKDSYDLAYGYVLRKDYAQAEEGFRAFLRKYPGDRLAADANFWLGESMFQRQRWRDAAESFLTVTTKFETSGKAPDALLRLGQSLAALNEKEAACAAFGEVGRKYPRASLNVKQGVEREQKRVHC